MAVTLDDVRATAEQLLDALDAYDRFLEGWPYESKTVPARIQGYHTDRDQNTAGADASPEEALTDTIIELYYEARDVEATYIQQVRKQGRSDWAGIVSETDSVRDAARQVHMAGYKADSKMGERGYLLPKELCPAYRVSMNAGSSSVMFPDRIAQYCAVADHFNFSHDVIYHPGSGHDVSPSVAFPESRVVYVDIDEAAMDDLTREEYEAVGADATGYELAMDADMIVFRNAGLIEEAVVDSNLRPGGWVLANDHLESARHLVQMDALELVGVVPDSWTGESPPVDAGRLDGYLSRPGKSGDSSLAPPFAKGTPLDLYVFRNNE